MAIKQIYFSQDLIDYENVDIPSDELQFIDDLKKVNLFIGPNNSGKSRIMRTLFWGKIEVVFSNEKTHQFEEDVKELQQFGANQAIVNVDDFEVLQLENFSMGILVNCEKNTLVSKNVKIDAIPSYPDRIFNLDGNDLSQDSNIHSSWRVLAEKLRNDYNLIEVKTIANDLNGVYFPVLRGTRPLISEDNNNKERSDIYMERTRRDYFDKMNDTQKHKIFGGYNVYQLVEDLLLGDVYKRTMISEYENFLAENFFHKKVVIIPKRGEDVLLITIGEEEERLIYDLGDGVQAIILLTFQIFMKKDEECIFYIEEPELHLHPSLQRKFLKCLSLTFPKHQYFLSTHSNHFLEAISEYEDVSIYSFKKAISKNKFHVQKLTSVKTEVLDNLGVRNSSVLMANCTIWVEGITDRLYIGKFLEVYSEYQAKTHGEQFLKFKEDQHYSFVEYAGSNLVHWSFGADQMDKIKALSVSNNILLVADSDYDEKGNISKAKQARFRELKSSLSNRFVLIGAREIENVLAPITIQKVIAEYENKDVQEISFKNQKSDYQKKFIGKWINENVEGIGRDYSSGRTISDKLNFCKKAIRNIESHTDLSPEARKLCKTIYNFIKERNEDYIEKSSK